MSKRPLSPNEPLYPATGGLQKWNAAKRIKDPNDNSIKKCHFCCDHFQYHLAPNEVLNQTNLCEGKFYYFRTNNQDESYFSFFEDSNNPKYQGCPICCKCSLCNSRLVCN